MRSFSLVDGTIVTFLFVVIVVLTSTTYASNFVEGTNTQRRLSSTGPARTSCNAAFSAPCSRVNSEWLATDTATKLSLRLESTGTDVVVGQQDDEEDEELLLQVFQDVTDQLYNFETGFYPFIFDKVTSKCLAHGANPNLVGLTLQEIYQEMGIGFSLVDEVHQRFITAAATAFDDSSSSPLNDGPQGGRGDWVQYLWRENDIEERIAHKVAFVTNLTDAYYLGVGYQDEQLPLDLPCSDKFDSWCSINNVRSLVGKAETRLNEGTSVFCPPPDHLTNCSCTAKCFWLQVFVSRSHP